MNIGYNLILLSFEILLILTVKNNIFIMEFIQNGFKLIN